MLSLRRLLLLHVRLAWKQIDRQGESSSLAVGRYLGWGMKIYLLLQCLLFGYFLDIMVRPFAADGDVIRVIDRYLPAYFLGVLLVRFFIEKSPSLLVRPFLVLPVRSRAIYLLLLVRLLTTPFALATVLLVVPLWVKYLLTTGNTAGALLWFAGFACLHVLCALAGQVFRGLLSDFRRGVLFIAVTVGVVWVTGAIPAVSVFADVAGTMLDAMGKGDLTALALLAAITMLSVAAFRKYVRHSLFIDIR